MSVKQPDLDRVKINEWVAEYDYNSGTIHDALSELHRKISKGNFNVKQDTEHPSNHFNLGNGIRIDLSRVESVVDEQFADNPSRSSIKMFSGDTFGVCDDKRLELLAMLDRDGVEPDPEDNK